MSSVVVSDEDAYLKLKKENIQLICRVCLNNGKDNTMHNVFHLKYWLFQKKLFRFNIVQFLQELFKLTLKNDTCWPKMICEACLGQVTKSYILRQQCEKTQRILLKFFNKFPPVGADVKDGQTACMMEWTNSETKQNESTVTTNFKENKASDKGKKIDSKSEENALTMSSCHNALGDFRPPSTISCVPLGKLRGAKMPKTDTVFPASSRRLKKVTGQTNFIENDEETYTKHKIEQDNSNIINVKQEGLIKPVEKSNSDTINNTDEEMITKEDLEIINMILKKKPKPLTYSMPDIPAREKMKLFYSKKFNEIEERIAKLRRNQEGDATKKVKSEHQIVAEQDDQMLDMDTEANEPVDDYFFDESAFYEEEEKGLGQQIYKCAICREILPSFNDLCEHRKVHDRSIYQCTICDVSFGILSSLRKHRRVHVMVKKILGIFQCGFCPETFTDERTIRIHNRIHQTDEPRSHDCTLCHKTFSRAVYLENHMIHHTGEYCHFCDVCGKGYVHKSDMIKHQCVHAAVIERPFICDHCGETSATKAGLALHMALHSRARSLMCLICNEQMESDEQLANHMDDHRNEKIYCCKVCPETFYKKSTLRTHMKRHPVMTAQCYFCRLVYPNESIRDHHMTEAHSEYVDP